MVTYRKQTLRRLANLAGLSLSLLTASGCKIVSIQEDREARERRSENFDAAAHVSKIWAPRIMPTLEQSAVDIAAFPASKLDAYGKMHGRQASEGSPWTFVLRGEGTVTAVDRSSRQGTVTITSGSREVVLETGPVITESTVRDALPMFDFNDFADQMAYAAVGRALNEKALASSASARAEIAPGQRIRFLGVSHVSPEAGPLRILPLRIEPAN